MAFGEQFLTDPATFPLSCHGEPWGNEHLTVDFVGGPYLITGLSSEQDAQLRNHYDGSCSNGDSGQDACVTIQIIKTSSSVFKDIQEFPWNRTFDLDHHADYLNIAGLHVIARLSLRPSNNALLWTDRSSHSDFCINIFENIFRIIVTYRLHQNGGMLIHSACVVDDESAILFPGRSNDGKSTLSKISLQSGRTVLSDDMNALTWVDENPLWKRSHFQETLDEPGQGVTSTLLREFSAYINHPRAASLQCQCRKPLLFWSQVPLI